MGESALRHTIVIYQSKEKEMLQTLLQHLFSNSGTEEDSLKVAWHYQPIAPGLVLQIKPA